MRSQHSGVGDLTDGGQTGMEGTSGPHHEVMTLTDLQKMSAQLSGYYTGLTQGLSQEEHQAVMRFFLDNIREVHIPPPSLPQRHFHCPRGINKPPLYPPLNGHVSLPMYPFLIHQISCLPAALCI